MRLTTCDGKRVHYSSSVREHVAWEPEVHTHVHLQIFTLVDADGSGQICAGEVKHLMHLLGERVDTCDVEALMAEFDLDGSGEVDLTEFIFVIAMQRKSDFNKKDVIRYASTAISLCMGDVQARQLELMNGSQRNMALSAEPLTFLQEQRRLGLGSSTRKSWNKLCCNMAQPLHPPRKFGNWWKTCP